MKVDARFCVVGVALLLAGCQHHYREHHASESRMSPYVPPSGVCRGQCRVDVFIDCNTGPSCIRSVPDVLLVPTDAPPSPPNKPDIRFQMQGNFDFDVIQFSHPQFQCSGGGRVIVCRDNHETNGRFKYSIAVRGVAGPPLDPFVIND